VICCDGFLVSLGSFQGKELKNIFLLVSKRFWIFWRILTLKLLIRVLGVHQGSCWWVLGVKTPPSMEFFFNLLGVFKKKSQIPPLASKKYPFFCSLLPWMHPRSYDLLIINSLKYQKIYSQKNIPWPNFPPIPLIFH